MVVFIGPSRYCGLPVDLMAGAGWGEGRKGVLWTAGVQRARWTILPQRGACQGTGKTFKCETMAGKEAIV